MPRLSLMLKRISIPLGEELGRGGEGTVFAVEGPQDWAAKIYLSPLDYRKAWKLLVMARAARPSLLKIAAWPLDVLIDDKKGTPHGFIMPRVDAHRHVHELYTPKSRLSSLPEADFRFLVHVAANVARAFAIVHEQGHVVGDVNHGNLLVGTDGTVKFIDCDSFQIGNPPNVYTCDVGVPLFTAPELQGRRTFRGLVRTANHDLFGLAVLLFHFLYMGRHPFAGRYSGPDGMPIEKLIGQYRFAYGPDRHVQGISRPPNSVPLEAMGDNIAKLFRWAFGRAGSKGGRPSAETWFKALKKLQSGLRACSLANWHYYPAELPACPWCTVELHTGKRLFEGRIADTGTLWNAILNVPGPGEDPALPPERTWHPPPGIELPSRRPRNFRQGFSVGIGLVFAGFAAYFVPVKDGGIAVAALAFCSLAAATWPWVSREERIAANKVCQAQAVNWEGVLARWQREAGRDAFDQKLRSLEDAHAEISKLIERRRNQERQFQFDPSEAVHWREVEARIQKLLLELRQGPDELLRLGQEIKVTRARLMPMLEKAWDDLKIAEARRDAI